MDCRVLIACCKFRIRTHTDIDILAYFSSPESRTSTNIRCVFRAKRHGITRFRQSGYAVLPSLISSLTHCPDPGANGCIAHDLVPSIIRTIRNRLH